MAAATLGYSRGSAGVEDIWKVATELQQARSFRRSSQPVLVTNYRRDSLAREPFQSYRSGSVARDSVNGYRSGSISRDPIISNYRRDSVTRNPFQDHRRTSVTSEPFQHYRRDSLATDSTASYRRDSLTRDSSMTRETTEQSNATANGTTGRRGSDADDININWIEKYKRSDHHTDRLVNQKLDDAKAMTASLSEDRSSHLNRSSSAFSSATSNSQSQVSSKPVHYEGTNKLTVFLQPAVTPRSYATSHLSGPEQSRSTFSSSSGPSRPPPSSSRTDYRSPVTTTTTSSDRFYRPSSVLGSSSSGLPISSAFRRRYSIDSSLTSRSSAFTPVIATSSNYGDFRASPVASSQFSADLNQSHPYRPTFSRAPSLPPSFQSRPPSSLPLPSASITTNGYSRSSVEGLTSSGRTSRRFSLANISDLSTPNYRRSVDFGASKGTTGGYRSSNVSSYGSEHGRRSSYDTLSPMSSLSPLSPISPSHLPPPSERIFGARGTHSTLRRYRRSLADG